MVQKPKHVFLGERQVTCMFCQHPEFWDREVKLNTTGMSLLGMDWANQAANGLVCTSCGYVQLFLNRDLRFRDA